MIWDDARFRKAYRARLGHAQASGEAEVRAQAVAFQAETARAGGSNGEYFTQRAGAAADVMLSGYVRSAIDAFDKTLADIEAELVDADVNVLRASLEQEIARRAKALPATLRDFTKHAAPPARLRAILAQAPVKARRLLAERLSAARERVHVDSGVRACEVPGRAIFIGYDVRDETLADALKVAISAAVGNDVAVSASSDLESVRSGRDGSDRALTQLKKSRMTLLLVTPHSIGDPCLWWTLGVAEGAGRPVFALLTPGVSDDTALPLRADKVIGLARREEIVRLLRAIQGALRRRGMEPSQLGLEDLLREASGAEPYGTHDPAGAIIARRTASAP